MMACERDETYGPVSLASTASRGRVSLDGVDATVTGRRGDGVDATVVSHGARASSRDGVARRPGL